MREGVHGAPAARRPPSGRPHLAAMRKKGAVGGCGGGRRQFVSLWPPLGLMFRSLALLRPLLVLLAIRLFLPHCPPPQYSVSSLLFFLLVLLRVIPPSPSCRSASPAPRGPRIGAESPPKTFSEGSPFFGRGPRAQQMEQRDVGDCRVTPCEGPGGGAARARHLRRCEQLWLRT